MIFSNGVWTFGSQELISTIAAASTFLAVIVSLYLSQRSKVIKYKVVVNDICGGLSIYNVGHGKFNITCFGIVDGKDYIVKDTTYYSKILTNKIHTQRSSTNQEITIQSVVSEPGDLIEVNLDYINKEDIASNKVYLFLKINNKIKKFKFDLSQFKNSKSVSYIGEMRLSKKQILLNGYYFHDYKR